MTKESVKKFIKDHKKEIISGAGCNDGLIVACFEIHRCHKTKLALSDAQSSVCELLRHCFEASDGCDVYGLAKPESVWAAFNKDGSLVDAVVDIDGDLIEPKMLMVFGTGIKR